MPTPAQPMPPGLQTIFANSLKRPGATGDAIQSAINQAAQQYGGEGLSYMALWWMLYADKVGGPSGSNTCTFSGKP